MRRAIPCLAVIGAIAMMGCSYTGFVQLSEPAPAAPMNKPLPVYATKDIGRPYVVLGYVFRTTEGHKAGLQQLDEHMYLMRHDSELMQELLEQALARGADAIVGLELFPTLNGWGQPIGFSVGGLAVKFSDAGEASGAAAPSPVTPASAVPAAPAPEAPREGGPVPATTPAAPASHQAPNPEAPPALPSP